MLLFVSINNTTIRKIISETTFTYLNQEAPKVLDDFVEGCKFTIVGIEKDGAQVKGKLQLLQDALGEALEFPALSLIEQHLQMMER